MRNINNNMHDTAHRLKEIRQSKNLSQSEFAGFLGVSLRSYQYYEIGSRPIPIDLLRRLAEMGTNIHWLLIGRGDMLLKEGNEVEEKRLLAEYWQTNYNLLDTAVKIAYQRLVDSVGKEQAEKIFKEVKAQSKVNQMSSDPARKAANPTKVIKKGDK